MIDLRLYHSYWSAG